MLMEALAQFAKAASIPESATWRAFRRGVGVVVTAEWAYGAPGAVPALEVDLIGGIPVLKEAPKGPEGEQNGG